MKNTKCFLLIVFFIILTSKPYSQNINKGIMIGSINGNNGTVNNYYYTADAGSLNDSDKIALLKILTALKKKHPELTKDVMVKYKSYTKIVESIINVLIDNGYNIIGTGIGSYSYYKPFINIDTKSLSPGCSPCTAHRLPAKGYIYIDIGDL